MKDIEEALIFFKHIDEQTTQARINFFRELGGDWERGDILLLNTRFFPEFMYVDSGRIRGCKHLPDDWYGAFVSPKIMYPAIGDPNFGV